MKHIAVEELAEHSINYLTGNEALAIEHNGEVVGFYYPKNDQIKRKSNVLLNN